MDSVTFYCSYCDEISDHTPCRACGHQPQSMTPVKDAYLADCRVRLQVEGEKTREVSP